MKHCLFFIFGLVLSNSSLAQQYLSILHQKGLLDTQFLQKPEIKWCHLLGSSLTSCSMIPLQMNLPDLDMDCYNLEHVYTDVELNIFNTPKALIYIFPSLYCEKVAQPYVFFHSYGIDTIWDEFETITYDPETFEEVLRKDFKLTTYSVLDSFDNARFEEEQVRCTYNQMYDPETFEYGGYVSKCTGSLDYTYERLIFQHWAYLDTLQEVKSYPAALELHVLNPSNDDDYILKFILPIYSLPKNLDSLNIIWAGRVTIIEDISGFKLTSKDSSILQLARQNQAQKIWKNAFGKIIAPQKLDSSEVTKLAFLYDFYLERNGKFYASYVSSAALATNDPSYFIHTVPSITTVEKEPKEFDEKKSKKNNKKKLTKKRKK